MRERVLGYRALIRTACESIDSAARAEYEVEGGSMLNVTMFALSAWYWLGTMPADWDSDEDEDDAHEMYEGFTRLLEDHLVGLLLLGTPGNLAASHRDTFRDAA